MNLVIAFVLHLHFLFFIIIIFIRKIFYFSLTYIIIIIVNVKYSIFDIIKLKIFFLYITTIIYEHNSLILRLQNEKNRFNIY